MDNRKLVLRLLPDNSQEEFVKLDEDSHKYIISTLYNIVTYIDSSITIDSLYSSDNAFDSSVELYQKIYDENNPNHAFTLYINGDDEALLYFANKYSDIICQNYSLLSQEAINDFISLSNTLFIENHYKESNIRMVPGKIINNKRNYSITPAFGNVLTIIPLYFNNKYKIELIFETFTN